MKREDICYLTFILQSYNGLALVRTIEPQQALIEALIAPQREALFEDLLESLCSQEGLEIIPQTFDSGYEG